MHWQRSTNSGSLGLGTGVTFGAMEPAPVAGDLPAADTAVLPASSPIHQWSWLWDEDWDVGGSQGSCPLGAMHESPGGMPSTVDDVDSIENMLDYYCWAAWN